MSDLAGFRSKLRAALNADSTRYPDALVDQALRRALGFYSRAAPDLKTADLILTLDGRDQPLAGLEGVLAVLEMVYPFSCADAPAHELFFFFRRGGAPHVRIGGGRVPLAGETLRLRYAAAHTIAGLDLAASTTLPPGHEEALAAGAAAYAVIARSASQVEAFGAHRKEPPALTDWATAAIQRFHNWLLMAGGESALTGCMPNLKWRLDRWDN